MVETKSRQRLRRSADDWWIMGADDQLAEHPYYKEGRPGGCEINCEEAVVTYSTHTPQAKMERLTSFDFSCLTRFIPCKEIAQLLPAARDWHLYKDEDIAEKQFQESLRKPCTVPLWAIARDSRYALAVEGVSAHSRDVPTVRLDDPTDKLWNKHHVVTEEAQVRIVEVLKGAPPWPVSSVVMAHPYSAYAQDPGAPEAEHLRPGQRYIVFPVGDDSKDQSLTTASPISLEQCGVWGDTPENRAELSKGMAQNDNLPGPESR